MCIGNLCEPCKIKHGKKKISQNHEIVPLTSRNEEMLNLLTCETHKKKLKCYCKRCRELVCSECVLHSHSQHFLISMSTVYKEYKDQSGWQKEEIKCIILPTYNELLVKEKEKKVSVS